MRNNFGERYFMHKVKVATMTHDHDDTTHAILTLLVVPAAKWVNL